MAYTYHLNGRCHKMRSRETAPSGKFSYYRLGPRRRPTYVRLHVCSHSFTLETVKTCTLSNWAVEYTVVLFTIVFVRKHFCRIRQLGPVVYLRADLRVFVRKKVQWIALRSLFLPRDARRTLARYMLSSCVRLSVCLSQAGIVSKPLNTESRKQRHAISQGI